MKRVFGNFEIAFDILYLFLAFMMGLFLLLVSTSDLHLLAGIMALILVIGDSFHLIPRIKLIITRNEESLRAALGRGKQITSVSMTIFYLLLWQIGLLIGPDPVSSFWSWFIYIMSAIRLILCFLPYNHWTDIHPPVKWGIYRNIPFFVMGLMAAVLFFRNQNAIPSFHYMWLAVSLSFLFYLPVVLFANRSPRTGMLMLPKTCCYLWMICMFLFL